MTAQTHLFPPTAADPTAVLPSPSKRRGVSELIRERLRAGREATHLFTVASLSGGRSSAMMAREAPADLNIFGLVTTDDPRYHIKDAAIRAYVWTKLQTELVYATLESDETIGSIMDLEQYLVREIIMVAGASMDNIVAARKYLPNVRARFCTYEMKIKPIFDFLMGGYRRYPDSPAIEHYFQKMASLGYPQPGEGQPWLRMNIGYRTDYVERVASFTEHYWKDKTVRFPEFNNCEFCFNRTLAQLQNQFRDRPAKGEFWIGLKKKQGAQFRSDYSLEEIKSLPMGEKMDFTAQSMCNSGGCTD